MTGRRPCPPRLYVIADQSALAPLRLAEGIAEIAASGVEWIQLRAKNLPDRQLYAEAEESVRRLEGSEVELWIDDRADVAALLPVAGVHLGLEDLPPGVARPLLGDHRWIGQSTHDEAQLVRADQDRDVDVVALGPVFATRSKEKPDPVVGVARLTQLRRATSKPLLAIGGIDADSIGAVLGAGADTAVVLSAACVGDIRANCRRLLRAASSG